LEVDHQKNEPRFEGPFKINRQLDNQKYELVDVRNNILKDAYPIDQFKILGIEEKQFESNFGYIKKVTNHRKIGDLNEYLTHFEGQQDPEWVKESDFNSIIPINKYWNKKNNPKKEKLTSANKSSNKKKKDKKSKPQESDKPEQQIIEPIIVKSNSGRIIKKNTKYT